MIKRISKFLIRHPKITDYLKRFYDDIRAASINSATPKTTICEADPICCRQSSLACGLRVNLLVPALALQHVFGGISTALDFFTKLTEGLENVRIILTDQHGFQNVDNPFFSDWNIGALDNDDALGHWIVPAGNRFGKTLPVCSSDLFVATAWWTAISARAIQMWQFNHYCLAEPAKFVYLIQDFEPCFYPWSSRYALAESTYHHTDDIVAVFNTNLLKQFFDSRGYHFTSQFTFEPHLNRQLLAARPNALTQKREKRILVYGRPGVARNAFEIIVMALRLWISQYKDLEWEFVSAGEPHIPIDLGMGKSLISLGKLSLDQYAMELGRCQIGISLMISPHPSYPPLEMAVFGMHVITNHYGTKNLSLLSSSIHSVESVSPEELSLTLRNVILSLDLTNNTISVEHALHHYLKGESELPEICNSIKSKFFHDFIQ